MELHIVAVASATLLFLAVCSVEVAFQLRRTVARDKIRFRLFAVRQRLYLASADGLIPVSSPQFQQIRAFINLALRENETVGALAYISLLSPKNQGPGRTAFFDGLSPEANTELISILVEIGQAMLDLYRFNSRAVRILEWLRRTSARLEKKSPARNFDEVQERVNAVRSGLAA